MGACSSKPKTTEFEGSTEPSKETGVATADRSLESADANRISQSNEPGKPESTEVSQQTSQSISSKDEEPVVKGLSSAEEGEPHGVESKPDAFDRKVHSGAAESGSGNNGFLQKVDEGAGAANTKDVSDKAATVQEGASGDQDKKFEDKAVVLNEAGAGSGDAYVDKAVAAADGKGQDSRAAKAEGEQLISDSPGVTSPIIGVVQSADSVHVDDISESVDLATLETPSPAVDSTGRSKPPLENEREISAADYSDTLKDEAYAPTGLHEETSEESREASHDDPQVSPSVATISDDGATYQENKADGSRGKEELRASAYALDTEDKTELEETKDSQVNFHERPVEPREETSRDEVPESKGNAEIVDQRQPEAEDAKTFSEDDIGTMPEKGNEEQNGHAAEAPTVNHTQLQILETEKPGEDGKPQLPLDEGMVEQNAEPEHQGKVEKSHIQEAGMIGQKGERVDADKQDSPLKKAKNGSGEGETAFEDASDVPLKVESSTIEPGDRRSP